MKNEGLNYKINLSKYTLKYILCLSNVKLFYILTL